MVAGAAEALAALLEAGKEIVFVTNNPGRSGAVYAKRLREEGVAVDDERVVTAGVVTTRLAADAAGPGGEAFVVGGAGLKELVAAAGVTVLEGEPGRKAGVVVVAGHRRFDYEELLTATFALRGGARLFATSRDPTLPMPGGAWPGTGAILAAVETASGKTATIGGKPERHLFELALKTIGGSLGTHDVPKEPRGESSVGGIVERRELAIHEGKPERRAMAFTRTASGLCIANLHATNDFPELAAEDVLLAARTAVEWAGERPLLLGGDLNLRPAENPDVFEQLRERFGLAPPTAPRTIDHLLARGMRVVQPPTPWPPERREARQGERAVRLSDHTPVEARFSTGDEGN